MQIIKDIILRFHIPGTFGRDEDVLGIFKLGESLSLSSQRKMDDFSANTFRSVFRELRNVLSYDFYPQSSKSY